MTASTRPSEAALWTARFKLYGKDLPEVKEVHARILGLQEGEEATQEDFDSSPGFRLRWAVDETHPPTVIGEYWIDHLDSEGRLAKCKPNDFKFEDEWLPLYTRAGVTKQVSGLGSLLNTQGDSPLIAIIPPNMPFQYEREYVIHQLHKAECLARVSIYYDNNQQKQIAFCPYCGVMNENSATAYSHVRKHLGITFLCGSCYSKLSSRITDHRRRVHQVLHSEPLRHPEVAPLVLVGMAADRPLESNFFPGRLEGLLGRLDIAAPGESKPPTSSREGAGHLWLSAICEAISQIEQREVETPGAAGLPQCLDLRYEEDFLKK